MTKAISFFLRDCKRNYLPTFDCSLVSQKPLCNLTLSLLSTFNNWHNVAKIKAGSYIIYIHNLKYNKMTQKLKGKVFLNEVLYWGVLP